MMLAAELALAKVDVAIVERRPDHVLADSRAGGFHSRTIEVFDQRGVADRFLAEGRAVQAATFGTTVLGMSDFPTRHPYTLGLWQKRIEQIMAAWIAELPVRIYYGSEVTGFAQDDTGVDIEGDQPLRARYLVGCDGGRSVIRKAAGIEFPGWEATRSNLIAEVEVTEEPPTGLRQDASGVHALSRLEDGKTVRVVTTEREVGTGRRAHAAGSQRGADRCLRHRLRDPQPHMDLSVHRHDPSGRSLPRGPRAAGRRRGARALPGGRAGAQPRRAGCSQSGLEARPGGPRDLARSACSTATRTSATRSRHARSATRWRRPRSSDATSACRRWSSSYR